MALNWNFETDFIGQMIDKTDGVIYNLYTGNALCIALYETKDTYTLHWFAADAEHLNNILGDSPCLKDFIFMFNPVAAPYKKKVDTLIAALRGVSTITLVAVDNLLQREIYER